jgi:hypothetical protein
MHEGVYPDSSASLPAPFLSRRPIIAALVALVVGGAIATGVWWLTDNDADVLPQAATETRVIVAQPAEPGEGTAAKNEAGVAAAVGNQSVTAGEGTAAKDEAGTAASVGSRYGTSQYRPSVTDSTEPSRATPYTELPEGQASGALAGAGQGP